MRGSKPSAAPGDCGNVIANLEIKRRIWRPRVLYRQHEAHQHCVQRLRNNFTEQIHTMCDRFHRIM